MMMSKRGWMFLTVTGLTAALLGAAAAMDHHDEKKDEKPEAPKPAEVGKPAPDFTLKDVDGKEHTLSDYRGKTVILEWFNPECPFVVYLYERGELKTMANETHRKDEYVWIAINSNAPGTQGAGLEKNREYRDKWKLEFPVLIEEDNAVARLYNARRTPQMYIIDPEGVLMYNGAIDNAPLGNVRDGGERVNYVTVALEQMRNGDPVRPNTTDAYGCLVRYADAGRSGSREGRGGQRRGGDREGRRGGRAGEGDGSRPPRRPRRGTRGED